MKVIQSYLLVIFLITLMVYIAGYDLTHPELNSKQVIKDLFNGKIFRWWLT